MLFIVHPNKTVTAIDENINVGDTATDLIVISPFSGIQTVSLRYTLPNGEKREPAFATYAEGYPLGEGYEGNVYVMSIPPDMTEQPGVVQAMISFVDTNKRRMVTDTVTITVGGFTVLPVAEDETEGASFETRLEALLASAQNFLDFFETSTYLRYIDEALDDAVNELVPSFVGFANGSNLMPTYLRVPVTRGLIVIPVFIDENGATVGCEIVIPATLFGGISNTIKAKSNLYDATITLDLVVEAGKGIGSLTVSTTGENIPEGNYRLLIYSGDNFR